MTKVKMDWTKMQLSAEGHAGGMPAGENIICAGISAVTQALLNWLMDQEAKGFIQLAWKMDEKRGVLRIRAKPYAGHYTAVTACYQMAMTGLKAIRENYKDNIEIQEVYDSGNT